MINFFLKFLKTYLIGNLREEALAKYFSNLITNNISNKEITYALISNHKITGTESTIVSMINDKINILRPGRISKPMIEAQIKNLQRH